MFDNQTAVPGQVPNNLPIGEPDDMFAGSANEPNLPTAPVANTSPQTVSEQLSPEPEIPPLPEPAPAPTALNAGVLRPKADPASYGQPTITEGLRSEENVLRDPFGGRKVLITVVTLVTLGILGGGGAWIYFSFINPPANQLTPIINGTKPTNSNNINANSIQNNNQPVINTTSTTPVEANNPASSTDQRILFGEPVLDTDGDGLDDANEKKLGTDMLKWDTDSDGLSDGDEVMTWKTDPLKSDTDGDTYADGAEIKNGYNPKGTGKIFPVTPTTTAQK